MKNKEIGSVSGKTDPPVSFLSCSPFSWLNSHLVQGYALSLLTLLGLLRSDWGGLSASSPLGKWKDACGLRRWWLGFHVNQLFSLFSPKGEEALRPPRSDLSSPGRTSRLGEYPHFRWEFSRENGERERNDTGESVFPKLIRFLYFSGLFIYLFVIHRDEYRVTRRSADLTLVTIRCFI